MPDEKVRNILVVSVWATVCKTARPMLSDRCPVCPVLSVLSVCDVRALYFHAVLLLFFFA